ncbi:MAG TPA: DUF1963 domain-containing protein [Longimicrobium sp.]|nr:DUF1963 domain-containing protein [Longimicrobium sp.]
MNLYIFIPILVVFMVLGFRREIGEWIGRRRLRPVAPAANQEWRREFEARNPDGPPMTRAQIDEFKAWFASLALPAAELVPAPDRPVRAQGTRIGGPVWLADDEAWPADSEGGPLEFVAQVDFAELDPLPDFPEAGLLQFFIGRGDVFGADFDDPARGSARVLWRPGALVGGSLRPQPASTDDELNPWERGKVRETGLSLVDLPAVHEPDPHDWRIHERLEGQYRRPGFEEIDDLLWNDDDGRSRRHHVGGHPVFTQDDFRGPGRFDDYDRTLLRLTSDGNLIWGDVGEAVFLIRHNDLLARDFSSVIFYWDCT